MLPQRGPRPTDRLHLLLVDDDLFLLEALQRGIHRSRPGWSVHAAGSAVQAMRLLDRLGADLDVAVCDILMPELPGTRLLKLIRDLFPHIVRMSLSGMLDGPSLVGAGKHSECRLCKPIPAELLCLHIIATYCERHQLSA
ncbi:MAG: response regulator [Planctomycetes bacterium]|nr:response regulator [Planctomycetota bacterium]